MGYWGTFSSSANTRDSHFSTKFLGYLKEMFADEFYSEDGLEETWILSKEIVLKLYNYAKIVLENPTDENILKYLPPHGKNAEYPQDDIFKFCWSKKERYLEDLKDIVRIVEKYPPTNFEYFFYCS